jgi:hypothetical protein
MDNELFGLEFGYKEIDLIYTAMLMMRHQYAHLGPQAEMFASLEFGEEKAKEISLEIEGLISQVIIKLDSLLSATMKG